MHEASVRVGIQGEPGKAAASKGPECELSIVLPCLDEAETLERCIRKAAAFLERQGIAGEVIVADNGSTDGSQDIARCCGARLVEVPERGYGAAVYHGTLAARGKYVIMADSDDSYDLLNLMPLLDKLRAGHDLVMGNRFAGGVLPGAMPWKNRWIGNPTLSGICRLFFKTLVRDFHCGIRGYTLDAFKQMDLRTTGMEFASEIVIKATLLGMRVTEVATTLGPDGRSRPPHLRPWRDGWRHLRFMLLYSPRWLFLYPGIGLMLLGMALGLALLPGPLTVRGVTFDVHTLLYGALMILIGFQAVVFAVFAKCFAMVEGLLPKDPRFDRVFQYITLEVGLCVGAVFFLIGLAGSVYSVSSWARAEFGALDTGRVLRIVIPSGLLLALGCQIILSSFILSLIGMRRK